jgi:hypothetical protein
MWLAVSGRIRRRGGPCRLWPGAKRNPASSRDGAGSFNDSTASGSGAGLFRRSGSVLSRGGTSRMPLVRSRLAERGAFAGTTGAGGTAAGEATGMGRAAAAARGAAGRGRSTRCAAAAAGIATGSSTGRSTAGATGSGTCRSAGSAGIAARSRTARSAATRSTMPNPLAAPAMAGFCLRSRHRQTDCHSSRYQHQSSHHGRHSSEIVLGLRVNMQPPLLQDDRRQLTILRLRIAQL